MRRRSMFEILGVKDAASQRCHEPSCPDARSQDVQSVPAGGSFPNISSPKKLTSTSISGDLEGTFANMFQVYRLLTHLKSDKRISAKDERKQRRDCKAEFPALTVAAAALPRWNKLNQEMFCFHSILSTNGSFSRSSLTSRGSTTSPRSPCSPTSSTTPTSGTESTSR